MALLAMAVFDTLENNRTWMTKATLESLAETVDWNRHRLVVVDNGSCEETLKLYKTFDFFTVFYFGTNTGTARAVNTAWTYCLPGEVALKMDNDVTVNYPNWLDEIEEVFKRDPTIGICGLKRKDLDECPWNINPWYKSHLIMLPHEKGQSWIIVEKVSHVMGTCQAYNPLLLERIGYLYQMGGLYGFDDSLASLRSELAGFSNVFLPHIPIDHIDPGGTTYTQWKQDYGWKMMPLYEKIRDEFKSGKRSLYCEAE